MGYNYGPIVVSGKPMSAQMLKEKVVAVPGLLTSAFLALRLFVPEVQYKVVPFDRILEDVQKGKYDAGLLIHEGQLTYREVGLHKVVDLGEWWLDRWKLPLPLGGNVIKRNLGANLMSQISSDIRRSIKYGLDHREEAIDYAIQFSRGLDLQKADRFIGMYVNELTLDYGDAGRQAVRLLLSEAHKQQIIPKSVELDFV
jgi:1,4-dihydroxy-6-naphthoate synthase